MNHMEWENPGLVMPCSRKIKLVAYEPFVVQMKGRFSLTNGHSAHPQPTLGLPEQEFPKVSQDIVFPYTYRIVLFCSLLSSFSRHLTDQYVHCISLILRHAFFSHFSTSEVLAQLWSLSSVSVLRNNGNHSLSNLIINGKAQHASL